MLNGHCVCPATDTCAFVQERRPGAGTSTQHKRPSVRTPRVGPGRGGNQPQVPREGFLKSSSSALFMGTRLLGILII